MAVSEGQVGGVFSGVSCDGAQDMEVLGKLVLNVAANILIKTGYKVTLEDPAGVVKVMPDHFVDEREISEDDDGSTRH